jgi:hypothetical protein
MEAQKIPKGRKQCTVVQVYILSTRRKVPSFLTSCLYSFFPLCFPPTFSCVPFLVFILITPFSITPFPWKGTKEERADRVGFLASRVTPDE